MFIVMPESIPVFFKKYAVGNHERNTYEGERFVLPDKIMIHHGSIIESVVQIVTKDYAGSIGYFLFAESIYHKKPYDHVCDILERNEIRNSGFSPVKL